MSDSGGAIPGPPESRTVSRKRTRFSVVWVIPLVAAIAGTWVAVTQILGQGPEITIVLDSAKGLEAGKTKIDFDGVELGTVTKIRLSDDHKTVIATAQMTPKTEGFLVDDTSFWVVRPRISGGTVSGLGTLLSGAYIEMEIGKSSKARRHYEALVDPPVVQGDQPGRFFELKTPDLGSLDNGTPVFFRRLKVGEIASYKLDEDGTSFSLKAFVHAPYDQYVTPVTRFWHASGIDLSLTASGLSVQTQSLVSIVIGGIAFETPANQPVLTEAAAGAEFTLFKDRAEAFMPAAQDPQIYAVVFEQEVHGLTAGAPVDFRGIPIGTVTDVVGQLDAKSLEFSVHVTLRVDASRFGVKLGDVPEGRERDAFRHKLVDALVAKGARAQVRTGSLLTGALYVALDFFPDAPPATIDWSQQPPRLPTQPGEIESMEAGVAKIIKKLNEIPFKQIGDELRDTIAELDDTLVSAKGTFDNANALIEPNSVLDQQLDSTLQEVSNAARAVRILADYLERHPESLLRGKSGGDN